MTTKVTGQMSVSLDGFYAGPRFDGNGAWIDSAEAAGFFRVTRWATEAAAWRERQGFAGGARSVDSEIIREQFEQSGAYVMGSRMFAGGEIPWGEEPPFRAPVFVVTSRPREPLHRKGTTFTFVTDGLAAAVDRARAAAGGRNVAVAGGGTLLRGVLREGLLDELELHIAPVVLGSGMRVFDESLGLGEKEAIELRPVRVVETPQITHVRYAVVGRAALVLDDRGRGDGSA